VITIFYTLILIIGVHTLAIHRIPQRMAYYMLMLLLVAAAVSLIFRKRAFCSYVCPVGHMLGLYALISPFEWGASDPSVCKSCKTKDCFVKTNHYRLFGRSCTSNLYPAAIKDNRDCLLCTQCLKACPYDNLRLSTRWPFADFFRKVSLLPAQTGFVLLLSGFVVYEILSEWPVSKAVLTWVPTRLIDALAITGPAAGLVSATIMFVVFPAILFVIAAAAVRLMSDRDTTAAAAGTFALLLIPTMAGAHVTKSILKMVSRIPYWSDVFSDPKGIMTAQSIVDETLVLDKSVPDALHPVVSCAAAAVLLSALIATLVIFRRSAAIEKLNPRTKAVLLICMLAYWGIFGFTILRWRF
ncbi:MAG: 4Fe-4S binding protein, partial [Planctomycetota bacterium]